jgi:hypothetical protein
MGRRPKNRPTARILLLRLGLPVAIAWLVFVTGARAETFAPHSGRLWLALTGTNPVSEYEHLVGKHAAVLGNFIRWDGGYEWAIRRAIANHSRLLLHVSTASGQHEREVISPGEIARGDGDDFLISLNRRLARLGQPAYLRWLGEMNNCDNAYAPRRCDGSRRSDHSPRSFRQAWRRAVLVVRGGNVAAIDGELASLGMPPVDTDLAVLPTTRVAFIWSPMTGGSPLIRALRPGVFWPGARYVDWVGTSFYSRYPNFRFLAPFYKRFAGRYHKPFAFVEWAMWGSDDPRFVRGLFAWIGAHRWTRMIAYNQENTPDGPFVLAHYPRSAAAIRRKISPARFLAWAPEWRSPDTPDEGSVP